MGAKALGSDSTYQGACGRHGEAEAGVTQGELHPSWHRVVVDPFFKAGGKPAHQSQAQYARASVWWETRTGRSERQKTTVDSFFKAGRDTGSPIPGP